MSNPDLVIETPEDSVLGFDDILRQRDNAIKTILEYGMYDGSHHKQWVLDQALRALLENEYDHYIKTFNTTYLDEDGNNEYEDWDVGIPP